MCALTLWGCDVRFEDDAVGVGEAETLLGRTLGDGMRGWGAVDELAIAFGLFIASG